LIAAVFSFFYGMGLLVANFIFAILIANAIAHRRGVAAPNRKSAEEPEVMLLFAGFFFVCAVSLFLATAAVVLQESRGPKRWPWLVSILSFLGPSVIVFGYAALSRLF
jgi:hypothetical protein